MSDDISDTPCTPTSPLDLSVTSKQFPFRNGISSTSNVPVTTTQMSSRQMSIDDAYESPEVITQPKEEWHYRSIKDLAKNHLPYLAGIGPQRTPIRVKVSHSSLSYTVFTHKFIYYIGSYSI